ncbi:glycosyltransferase family 8 protein [Eubacteriaceae bacterium ES2]|nr:glycosyltransferase family 8 protein [Eubacteriaceae bacterium ES2]
MNILYTCDNNYIWLMGISVISLFENNMQIENINVYCLGENIDLNNKNLLQEIARKYKRKIVVLDVPKLDIPEILTSTRWPQSAFTRLYSGQLLSKDLHSILYLDCDTIICGNISDLGNFDSSKYVCYGIKDCISSTYKENIGLKKDSIYVNAGVLVLNLDKMREYNIKNEIDEYMKRYLKLINYADQDILNGIFFNKIGVLDPKYDVMTIVVAHKYDEIISLRKPTNYYSEEELLLATNKPVIIHYTTNMRIVRPWYNNTDHPLSNEFRKYYQISPWSNQVLEEMVFNSNIDSIIGLFEKFPDKIAYKILGIIHSIIKPLYVRYKANKSFVIKGE